MKKNNKNYSSNINNWYSEIGVHVSYTAYRLFGKVALRAPDMELRVNIVSSIQTLCVCSVSPIVLCVLKQYKA